MTDIRNANVIRETLITQIAESRLAGAVVRELLVISPTAALLNGLAREVLVPSPVTILSGQTSVTINTG
jgi:hypothetical protein